MFNACLAFPALHFPLLTTRQKCTQLGTRACIFSFRQFFIDRGSNFFDTIRHTWYWNEWDDACGIITPVMCWGATDIKKKKGRYICSRMALVVSTTDRAQIGRWNVKQHRLKLRAGYSSRFSRGAIFLVQSDPGLPGMNSRKRDRCGSLTSLRRNMKRALSRRWLCAWIHVGPMHPS